MLGELTSAQGWLLIGELALLDTLLVVVFAVGLLLNARRKNGSQK